MEMRFNIMVSTNKIWPLYLDYIVKMHPIVPAVYDDAPRQAVALSRRGCSITQSFQAPRTDIFNPSVEYIDGAN